METFILDRQDLSPFLTACETQRRVQIPVSAGEGAFKFSPLRETGPDAVVLDYQRTLLPPKKFFLPPEETLYRFDEEEFRPEPLDPDPLILFGLHPCDLHGLLLIDRFFMSPPHPDRSYAARRNNALLIGLGCVPDDKCFCASMGSQHIDSGYDLFFWDLGKRFYVLTGTEAGHGLIHQARNLFHTPNEGDRQAYLAVLRKRRRLMRFAMETSDLAQVMQANPDCAAWEALGDACFACGACTNVCPTCTCYDIFDRTDLSGTCGQRCRRWDSCLFRDFTRVAGEHHFRPKRSDRVKNRFFHKEVAHVKQFQRPACVGCGRCQEACPAGIDVVSVFRQVHETCA